MLPGEPLNSPALSRTNAVVRLRRHVLDTENLEAGCLQRTDRSLTAGARALARTRIGAGALSVDGKAAAMADAAVRADLAKALDRLRAVAAKVTFHLELVVDVLTKLRDLLVGEVLDLRVRIETERERNL